MSKKSNIYRLLYDQTETQERNHSTDSSLFIEPKVACDRSLMFSFHKTFLIRNGDTIKLFHMKITNVLNTLETHGVFVVIISETLQTIKGDDGSTINVDHTFLTTSTYLLDSLYIVGRKANNEKKFTTDIHKFI